MRSLRWAPTALWSLAILFLTSIPNPHIDAPKNSDKVVHFTVYAILGVLASRAAEVRRTRLALALLVIVCICAFGALDEVHQRFIPGRFPAVDDWVADTMGGIVGTSLVLLSSPRRKLTT